MKRNLILGAKETIVKVLRYEFNGEDAEMIFTNKRIIDCYPSDESDGEEDELYIDKIESITASKLGFEWTMKFNGVNGFSNSIDVDERTFYELKKLILDIKSGVYDLDQFQEIK